VASVVSRWIPLIGYTSRIFGEKIRLYRSVAEAYTQPKDRDRGALHSRGV